MATSDTRRGPRLSREPDAAGGASVAATPGDALGAGAARRRGLAERLQRLPEDDERLARLARCWYPEGTDGPSSVGAHANPVIRGYVADDQTDGLGSLLDRIADLNGGFFFFFFFFFTCFAQHILTKHNSNCCGAPLSFHDDAGSRSLPDRNRQFEQHQGVGGRCGQPH